MKLIASDFDGTVRTDEKGLQRDIEAIKKWKDAGNIFAIISGRNAPQIRDIALRYNIPANYVLGDSGNTCYVGDRLEYYHASGAEPLKELYDLLIEYNTYYIVVNCPKVATVIFRDNADFGLSNTFGKLEDITEFTQVSAVFHSFEEAKAAAAGVNARLGDKVCALQNFQCLDIVPDGRNKAVSVERLANKLGVDEKDIYCIGDNFNDILMLDRFASFVVENAHEEVKTHASVKVVPTVADMIEYLIENN